MTRISLTTFIEPPKPSCRNTLVCAPSECGTRRHHELAIEQEPLAIPESPGVERRASRARRESRRHRRNGEPDTAAAGLTEAVSATTTDGTLSGVTTGIDEQGDSTYEFH